MVRGPAISKYNIGAEAAVQEQQELLSSIRSRTEQTHYARSLETLDSTAKPAAANAAKQRQSKRLPGG